MPCSYYLPGEREAIEKKEVEERLSLFKRELDETTALLCSIAKLDSAIVDKIRSTIPDFSPWYDRHQERDNLRKNAERMKQEKENDDNRKMVSALIDRQQALKKLSASEIKTLGLKKLTKGELELIKKYKHLLY